MGCSFVKTYKPAVTGSRLILQFLLVATALMLAACAGQTGAVLSTISVQVAPATANIGTNQTQQFTATVSGTTNTAVTWQVSSTSATAASIGTINSSGLYTAPATVPTGGAVTVTATSQADATKTGTATVTVTAPTAITVAVSPKTASVVTGLTQQFSATVTNSSNTSVTWQVNNVTGGNATAGTISGTGLYTAPATVPSGAVTVTAVSVADNTKSDTAAVTVVTAVSVTMSPKTASVQAGFTKQFTTTVANTSNTAVTWQVNNVTGGNSTVGTISATGLYTAPTTVPASNPVTVKAISVADNTKSDTATVTVTAGVSVTVSPKTAAVVTSSTQQFTATVTNASNTSVTWQVNNVTGGNTTTGTISTTGLYTAPATVPSGAVTVEAISVVDNTKSDTAAVTVTLPVSVTVSPKTPSVQVALTQQFTATVANTSNTAVTWQVNNVTGGNATTGTISATGLFTAPATVPASNPVTVKAISVADNTKSDTATVTITPAPSVTVTIMPKRGGLTPGQTMTFTATVTGSSNTAVTWEVDGVAGGNSTVGVISTGGVYTAPNSGGVHNIVARSVADATATSAASPIGVTDLSGVATYHNDLSRDGANTREFALTTANVAKATFGKLFACTVDAAVYGQPLWVPSLTISGARHNVIIAVTQHDSIYAFDADASPCVTLWSKVGTNAGSLIPTGETWVVSGASGSVDVPCGDLAPAIGIVGTPVVDLATNTIYLVTKTKTISPVSFHQRLHALDITTGAEKFGGPVEISASIRSATFTALKNNQRPGLALVNGNVYIGWSSHCDEGAYQGFLMAYSASTLSQVATFTPAPNAVTSVESGIWMSGGAPAADSSNNLYLITGNGTFNADQPSAPNDDYGDTILKLGTTGGISVLDYFTPNNQSTEQTGDADLGSGGATILVDQPSGPVQHLVIGGGKDGILFLLNRDNLGKFTTTDSGAIQLLNIGDSIYATPAFWNNRLYIGGTFGGGHVQAFTFNPATGLFASPSSSQSPTSYGFPGATPSVSANGTSQGIVWAIDSSKNGTDGSSFGAAVLHAYDATNLATELWNSAQVAGDAAGVAVKFTVPTVANGKVYIGTQGEISAYGLKPQ